LPVEKYFTSATHRMLLTEPLRITNTVESYDIDATIDGGGISGQAGAMRLGIARSLGAHGVPVCVIDDETSIARASRYVQQVVRVQDLRSEQGVLDALALARSRHGLHGWVLYPTRDEIVAAIADGTADIGIVAGTYSSIYISSAVALDCGLKAEHLLASAAKKPLDDLP